MRLSFQLETVLRILPFLTKKDTYNYIIIFFSLLNEKKVPVLVLSAGLGDVIRIALKHYGLNESETFHIISNFLKTDGDTLIGFGCSENGKFIHPFNKNGLGCGDYFKVRTCPLGCIIYGGGFCIHISDGV